MRNEVEKRVVIYGRVSTLSRQDPEMQTRELTEYCSRRGWKLVGEYIDRGVSGAKDSRPELDRLMCDCRRRLVDAVVVYRYDRFARSLRHLVNALAEFDNLGIDFISLHEGVDTTTPNGRLIFGIFASIAEFERELIRLRVRSGLAAARARGKRLGRPPLREFSREEIQAILAARRKEGASVRKLAREFAATEWTIGRILKGQDAGA